MRYENRHFNGETIRLDGNDFAGCIFDNCVILFSGSESVDLVDCKFISPKIRFEDAAGAALQFLKYIHKASPTLFALTFEGEGGVAQ